MLKSVTAAMLAAIVLPAAAPAQTAHRTAYALDRATLPTQGRDLIAELRRHGAPPKTSGTLSYPYGIAVDVNSNIYVTNLFGSVNQYSPKYKLTGSITTGVLFPAAVGVAWNGTIYVANNGGNNVTVYSPTLAQIGTITDTTLQSPTSLYVDPDDDVWVLDAAGVLHAYLEDGAVLTPTHTGGNTVGPWGPYVTVWGIADNGGYDETFESRSQAIQSGPYLYNDFVDGSPDAAGEAQDQYGQEYVTNLTANQVEIWSADGEYIVGIINTPAAPYGVAVDTKLNRVYVVTTTLNEVYCYSTIAPYKACGIIH